MNTFTQFTKLGLTLATFLSVAPAAVAEDSQLYVCTSVDSTLDNRYRVSRDFSKIPVTSTLTLEKKSAPYSNYIWNANYRESTVGVVVTAVDERNKIIGELTFKKSGPGSFKNAKGNVIETVNCRKAFHTNLE